MNAVTSILLLGLALTAGAPAVATERVLPEPPADGWHLLSFPSISRHTRYMAARVDGVQALRAQSDCAAAALYLPLPNVDLAVTPRLRWRWKVEQGLHNTEERLKKGDDFAARVAVLFRFDPARASFWERLRHRVAEKVYGMPIPGQGIDYVWSSVQPAGSRWDDPYTGDAEIVSLGAGPLPQWTDERVDVPADYASIFGGVPPPLLAVGLMTDSDNTCERAAADYADFRFTSQ